MEAHLLMRFLLPILPIGRDDHFFADIRAKREMVSWLKLIFQGLESKLNHYELLKNLEFISSSAPNFRILNLFHHIPQNKLSNLFVYTFDRGNKKAIA